MAELTGGPILRAIVGFSAPLTLANLVQQSYLLVDGAIVGRYVGVGGLAAVGVSQPLYYLVDGAFLGIATGFSIRIARLTGAGRDGELAGTAAALAVATAVWSLTCLVLVLALAGVLLNAMGVHGDVAHDSRVFLGVLALAFPSVFGLGAVAALLRGLGNSRGTMALLAGSSLLNAVFCWLFVAVLRLGLTGAALATVVVSTAAFAAGLGYVRWAYSLGWRHVPRAALGRELRDGLRLGLPVAVQHVLLALGIMVLVWVAYPLGAPLIAALTVAGRLEVFAAMVFLDLSGGLTVFVAQNLGAGRIDRVRQGLRRTTGFATVLTLLVSALVIGLSPVLADLFTHDPTVRALIVRYIVITYPFFVLYTVMAVVHGYLNGAGRTVQPLACTVLSFLLVRLPLSYALQARFGATGVMWAVNAGWLVGLAYTVAVAWGRRAPSPSHAGADRRAAVTIR